MAEKRQYRPHDAGFAPKEEPQQLPAPAGTAPFDMEKAREIACGNVRDALSKGVPVLQVRMREDVEGGITLVLERIHPEGRVEYLGEAD